MIIDVAAKHIIMHRCDVSDHFVCTFFSAYLSTGAQTALLMTQVSPQELYFHMWTRITPIGPFEALQIQSGPEPKKENLKVLCLNSSLKISNGLKVESCSLALGVAMTCLRLRGFPIRGRLLCSGKSTSKY